MSIIGFGSVNGQNNSSSWISIESAKKSNANIHKYIPLLSFVVRITIVGFGADFLKNMLRKSPIDTYRIDKKAVGGICAEQALLRNGSIK